ncbi:MAG: DUF167 domain-containing protein [Candidatus Binatia bacterium]
MGRAALTVHEGALRLRLRVQPRSARTRVVGWHGDAIKVQVGAPPVDEAANRAVADLIASWLDLPRAAVRLVQGRTGRDKVVEVACDDPSALARRIEQALGDRVDKGGGAH